MELAEQKNLALNVLKVICKDIDGEALIAGGAIRNWEEGRLAKDIDIYLRCNLKGSGNTRECIHNLIKGKGVVSKGKDLDTGEYSLALPIKYLISFLVDGLEFQFIIVDSLPSKNFQEYVIGSFDLGICRIGINMFSNVLSSKEYFKDLNNKTLTFYYGHLSDSQMRSAMDRHIPKIMDYYPNHKLVLNGQKANNNFLPWV